MDRNLISKFMEVTGEGEAIASQYLSLADGNLESAISLLFESGSSGTSGVPEEIPVVSVPDDPEIRAPILPTQEILVPPDVTCSFPRASNNVFDRFRDFAVETRRQEEEMIQKVSGSTNKTSHQSKSKRLEDLFRPPCDILFLGSFNEAREYAKSINRWLLVNVQNQQEFSCQILNRDVWPNKQIREIIKDHFVLIQILSSTDDGKRYIDFYKVSTFPYLSIIDPRTGECMRTYNQITVDNLIFGLNDMLSTHASPDNVFQDFNELKEPSVPTEAMFQESLQSNAVSNSNIPTNIKRSRSVDKSEENSSSQSDAKASTSISTTNNNAPNVISKRSKIVSQTLKDDKVKEIDDTDTPVDSDAPMLKLCLRLPNGCKETISMFTTEKIGNFIQKMEDMGYNSTEYTFLIPFPKTNIGELSRKLPLVETILYPSNTVFITKI